MRVSVCSTLGMSMMMSEGVCDDDGDDDDCEDDDE
jgi:hypothetical protein